MFQIWIKAKSIFGYEKWALIEDHSYTDKVDADKAAEEYTIQGFTVEVR